MSKNTTFNRYHLTISPRKTSIESLDKVIKLLRQYKTHAKDCYVIETGKQGTHPHLHILIEFTDNKRLDTLKTSVKTKLKKVYDLVENTHLLVIKPAYNPQYLITQYMQKETEMVNNGFDLEEIKKELRSHNKEVFRTDSQQLVITRSSLLRLYRQYKDQLTPFSICDGVTNEHVHSFMKLLETHNYNISFLIWNKKQTMDIILYANENPIEFFKFG